MRYLVPALVLALCTASEAMDSPLPGRDTAVRHHVDLSSDDALATIRREDPARYRQIQQIVEAAQVTSCETLPAILKARFDVLDTRCSPYLLLASFPPKRRVTFVIEDTGYSLNVIQYRLSPAKVVPAIETGR